MALVVDEKHTTAVFQLSRISAFTTLRNNCWIVLNVIDTGKFFILFLSSKSNPLLKYWEGLQIGTEEDAYFIELPGFNSICCLLN